MIRNEFHPPFLFVEAAAKNIFRSSMRALVAVTVLIVLLCCSLKAAASSIPESEKIVATFIARYEWLEAFNDRNEREGHPERNEYIIDLNADWIEVRPGINFSPEDYTVVTKMLRDFNSNRKDNLRFYVVATGVLQYQIKSEAKLEQLPGYLFRSDNNLHAKFNDLLSTDDQSNLYNFYRTTLNDIRKGILSAMEAKGYTESVVYIYTGVRFYDADDKEKWYSLSNLEVTGALIQIRDKIRSKAKQQWVLPDATQPSFMRQTYGERIRLSIANIITAIGIEYDGGGSSATGITNCGKDPADIANETFKHSTEYNDAVTSMAKLLDAPTQEQKPFSPYMIVDKPNNFKNPRLREMILPDVVFNTEILPDKLNLLNDTKKKRSDYTLYVVFKEVPFVIPDNERAAFAQDVKNKSTVIAKQPYTIIVVVPYYACTSKELYVGVDDREKTGLDKSTEYVYPMLLMPAACDPDGSMNDLMNSALVREKSFRSGFDEAFKHIPKDHTAYLGYLLWNGQQVFKEYPEKRKIGFSNFADVHLFVDDRIEKIIPLISNCEREYAIRIAKALPLDRQDQGKFYIESSFAHEDYLRCLTASQSEIKKMFDNNPAPLFKELNAGKCTIRQCILAGEDGMLKAMYYMQASYHKKIEKFWTEKGASVLEEVTLEDKLFYGNKNPYPRKLWVLTAINAASFVASFVGWDFVFDATGAFVCIVIGDPKEAVLYGASIFVPAAIVRGWQYAKGLKNVGMLSEQAYKLLKNSEGTIVQTAEGLCIVRLGGNVSMVPGVGDGVDLLRALGIVDEEVLAAAKKNPSVRKGLEESMTVRQGDVITPRTGQHGGHSVDEIQQAANDREIVKRYNEELAGDPSIDFATFLRKNNEVTTVNFRDAPGINLASLGKDDDILRSIARIKPDGDWFDVIVHGNSDKFGILRDGKWVYITHRDLYNYLKRNPAFVNAKGVRLISCQAGAKNLAENFAKKSGKKVKAANVIVGVAPDGSVVSRGGDGYWSEFNGRDWSISFEKPGRVPEENKIPQAANNDDVVYLSFFDDVITSKFLNHPEIVRIKSLVSSHQNAYPHLSLDEMCAVYYYSQNSLINLLISNGNQLDNFHKEFNKLLNMGLSKAQPYPGIIYSGLDKRKVESMKVFTWEVGKTIDLKTYTSCSKKIEVAAGYSEGRTTGEAIILSFVNPKGIDMGQLSAHNFEAEVLLNRDSRFKILKVEQKVIDGETYNIVTLGDESAALLQPAGRKVTPVNIPPSPELTRMETLLKDTDILNEYNNLVNNKVKQGYGEVLSPQEEAVLRHFVLDGIYRMNMPNQDKVIALEKEFIQEFFEKLPKYDGKVYHAAVTNELPSGMVERKPFRFNTFLNSTASERKALEYLANDGNTKHIMYRIRSKTGAHIQDLDNIEPGVFHKPGEEFTVYAIQEETFQSAGGPLKVTVVDMGDSRSVAELRNVVLKVTAPTSKQISIKLQDGTELAHAVLNSDGYLVIKINVMQGPNRTPVASGTRVIEEIFNGFRTHHAGHPIKGLLESWSTDPGMDTNLNVFMKFVNEKTATRPLNTLNIPELNKLFKDAATQTPSGKILKGLGYVPDRVETQGTLDHYESVKAYFKKE